MTTTLRKHFHSTGAASLRAGAYQSAIQVLEEGLLACGPHVGLLSELVHAYYLSGDCDRFRLSLERLESEFKAAGGKLSVRSQARTLVTLGKFFEEQGRVADAFSAMDSALATLPPGDALTTLVQAQRLRLLASFGREADVAALYQICLQISESKPDAYIEVFHALLVAECRLFGFALAWQRLLAVAGRGEDLQAADLSLCLVDILEVLLDKRDTENTQIVLSWIDQQKISPQDDYEKEILRLARGLEITEAELLRWSRLTPMARLRLLSVAPESADLQRQRLFLVQAFDHRTRKLLEGKWPSLLARDQDLLVIIKEDTKEIFWQSQSLSLRKSPHSWAILTAFTGCQEVRPGDLLARLAKHGDSEQELESLRINVIRLNRKLSAALGVAWVLRYSKAAITRNPQVRLTSA